MFQNLEPWRNSIWIISVNNQTHNNSYSKSHYSIIFFWFQKTTKQFLSNKYTISTLKMAFTIFTPPKLLTMPQVIYWRTWQWKYVIDCQRPFIFFIFVFFSNTVVNSLCDNEGVSPDQIPRKLTKQTCPPFGSLLAGFSWRINQKSNRLQLHYW